MKSLVFLGGILIDGFGHAPIDNTAVILNGSKIIDVGKIGEIEIPNDAKIIKIKDKIIMPGLIDAHVHFSGAGEYDYRTSWITETEALRTIRSVADSQKLIDAGYTAVRCCFSKNGPSLKRAIDMGVVVGPRIMAARQLITRTGGHESGATKLGTWIPINWVKELGYVRLADGEDECRKAVREQIREGADFIKICTGVYGESKRYPEPSPDYTQCEVNALVDEAHRIGVEVAAHATSKEGIINAINAGVKTIEHGLGLDEEICKIMVKKNVILVPTIAVGISKLEDINNELNKKKKKLIETAKQEGVKIAAGSDYGGLPGWKQPIMGNNAFEIEMLVKFGLTPLEALTSATKIGSEALGLDNHIGTIEPGKLADLIILEKNPLENIKNLQNKANIKFVIKNGEFLVNR